MTKEGIDELKGALAVLKKGKRELRVIMELTDARIKELEDRFVAMMTDDEIIEQYSERWR